jgi:hypothetical protein
MCTIEYKLRIFVNIIRSHPVDNYYYAIKCHFRQTFVYLFYVLLFIFVNEQHSYDYLASRF